MSLREGIKKVYFKHLGSLLAGALITCSAVVIGASYFLRNRWDFWHNLLLNLGPEILGMAITVGLVDYLFTRRNRREHQRAVNPRVRDLLIKFQFLQAAYDNYLIGISKPPADVIERYITALKETVTTAIYLVTLVDEQQPAFAGLLTRFIDDAQSQFLRLDDAVAAVRYGSHDADLHIGKIRTEGEQILMLSSQLRSQVCAIYEQPNELGREKIR